MNRQRLFLLLSLATGDDWKWYESWDEDWDYLLDYGFIDVETDDDIPTITKKGEGAIDSAIKVIDT